MSERRTGLIYLRNSANTEISFPVKRENITTERNFKINEQEMYSNNSKHHSVNFYHNGDAGLSFSVTAVLKSSETALMKVLDNWYTTMTPFKIVFGKHLGITLPLVSKNWIITKLSLKQEMDTVIEWDITFKTYNPPKKISKVQNNLVNRTSKSYKWKNNCKKSYKKLTYKKMKKKKGNDCAKLLNKIMIELGYMKKSKKKTKTNKKDKKGKPIYKTTSMCRINAQRKPPRQLNSSRKTGTNTSSRQKSRKTRKANTPTQSTKQPTNA